MISVLPLTSYTGSGDLIGEPNTFIILATPLFDKGLSTDNLSNGEPSTTLRQDNSELVVVFDGGERLGVNGGSLHYGVINVRKL